MEHVMSYHVETLSRSLMIGFVAAQAHRLSL